MKQAGKGIALLLVVLAAVGGVGFWLLNSGGQQKLGQTPGLASKGGGSGSEALPDAASAANLAQPAAQRDAQPTTAVESAPAAAGANVPTAEYLVGTVVDESGRPVAGADVSYGPGFLASLGNRAGRANARGGNDRGGRGGRGNRGGRGGRGAFPFGRAIDETPLPTTNAKSGADGTFRLPKVARGEGLELRVDHPDYVVMTRNDLVLPASGLDVGRLTLEAGGTVTGFVYGPGGAKLAGAEVVLLDAPDDDANRRGFTFNFNFGVRGERRATSDEEGRFRLTGMPKGKAIVEASCAGLCTAVSDPIEVVPLQVAGEVMLHLERGYELSGVVKDASGKPVGGAEVYVVDNNDWMRLVRSGGQPDYVTDDDGKYAISGLKAIAHDVAASAEGYARANHPNIDPSQVATLDITLGATLYVAGSVRLKGSSEAPRNVKVQVVPWFGNDNIQIPGFEGDDAENKVSEDGRFRVEGLEPGDYRVVARADGTTRAQSEPIKIAEGQSVENVVIEVDRGATVEGRVLDPTGAPVANADVRAFEPPPAPGAGGNEMVIGRGIRIGGRGGRAGRFNFDGRRSAGRTKTDSEGRYSLQHLLAGTYEVEVSHADFATLRGTTGEVATAETKRNVDFALGRGGTIEGNVVAVDGSPRAGDRIEVRSKAISSVTLNAVSDANGYYRVDHVPAGEAVATREEAQSGNGPGDMAVVFAMAGVGGDDNGDGKTVLIEEGQTVRVDFSQVEKPVLEGIVTCSDGPVAGATVTASSGGGGFGGRGIPGIFGGGDRKEATTGADGRYRITDLDPGDWRVSARHPQGPVPTTLNVKLEGGATVRQDFALEGGVIEGLAVAEDGKTPIEGATVRLERVEGDGGGNTTGEVRMEFAIAAGGPLGGGGRGARTMRFGGPGDDNSRVASQRDGSFRIPWVPAGKYRVRVTHPAHLATTSDTVELAMNGHVEGLKVALPAAARLKVTVRSKADGRPLEGHSVQLGNDADGREFGFTDSDGVASFDSLAPGAWNITVREGGGRASPRGGRNDSGPQKTVTCEAGLTAETIVDF